MTQFQVPRPRSSTASTFTAWLFAIVILAVVLAVGIAINGRNDYYNDCSSRWDSYIAGSTSYVPNCG